jgi:hypothetical protein
MRSHLEIDAMKGAAYLQGQTLDATSTQHLQNRVQKLANAAQVSFAECAILTLETILDQANNEGKVRRPTRSSGSRESEKKVSAQTTPATLPIMPWHVQ